MFGGLLAILIAAIAFVDARNLIIPDTLSASLAAGGFAYQSWLASGIAWKALAFAGIVAGLFLAIYIWFIRVRGVHGLGLGDVKMAGAASLWFSPWNFSLFLLITCITALLFVFFQYLRGARLERRTKLPFGPFLGLGVFVTWFFENSGMPTFIPNGGI
ncbi:MAG: prepilin peptidase [Rhizobiaceae bacterium]